MTPSTSAAVKLLVFTGIALALAALVVWLLSGCAHASDNGEQYCQRLLDQRDAATWGAAFSGGFGGAGGLSTAFPDDSNKDLRIGLGISAAVLGATAASLVALARMKSEEYETLCEIQEADAGAE